MSEVLKQQIWGIGVVANVFFMSALLVYDYTEWGLPSAQLYLLCYFLLVAGAFCIFKIMQIWSRWVEGLSEDPHGQRQTHLLLEEVHEQREHNKAYPIIFYGIGVAITLITIVLLIWSVIRDEINAQETVILIWHLFTAGGCGLLGFLSEEQ